MPASSCDSIKSSQEFCVCFELIKALEMMSSRVDHNYERRDFPQTTLCQLIDLNLSCRHLLTICNHVFEWNYEGASSGKA